MDTGMHMIPCIALLFSWVVICSFQRVAVGPKSTNLSEIGLKVPEFPQRQRTKRGTGMLVVKLLSRAIRLMPPNIRLTEDTIFVKSGGFRAALADFNSLKPTHVENSRSVRRGTVGSYDIVLWKTDEGKAWLYIRNHVMRHDGTIQFYQKRIRYDE